MNRTHLKRKNHSFRTDCQMKIVTSHINFIIMRNLFSFIFLFLVATASGQDVQHFVNSLLKTYPKARLLDIYKSSFQDFMGAEHLVSDKAQVKAYLDEELASVSLDDLMAWDYEPCGMNGNYYRVSIKLVLENVISEDVLLNAFIRSANAENRPSVDAWKNRWQQMMGQIEMMNLNLPFYQEDKCFIDSVLSVGKYAISHSPDYREAYRPHYRIVARQIFEQEILPLIPQKCDCRCRQHHQECVTKTTLKR